jgi:hypothetical protein
MTERTITEEELKTALAITANIDCVAFHAVVINAFPPPFTPKEGEIIVVSEYEDFRYSKIRVFSNMDNNNKYECYGHGCVIGVNLIPWVFAKPQTPTQKGEG